MAAKPKRIGVFSEEILARLGAQRDDLSALETRWSRWVSSPLREHARPVRYCQGQLSIQVDSAVWASRLRQCQEVLLTELRADPYFKDLSIVKVRIHPDGFRGEPNRKATASRCFPLSRQTAALIQSVAEVVSDPDLRRSLHRLADNPASMKSKALPDQLSWPEDTSRK